MPKIGTNIYKRKDGRYEGRILIGKTVYQKPRYVYVYGKTVREVKNKIEKFHKEEPIGSRKEPHDVRTAAQEWLQEMHCRWKPTTYDVYRRTIRQYIDPVLGNYTVSEIDRRVLEAFSAEMDNLSQKGELSAKYKKYACAIVCQIIEYTSNSYHLGLEVPQMPDFRIQKDEMKIPGQKDFCILEAYLMNHLEDDTCLGILVAQYTGIRIGELCALQWKDIDLDDGTVTIQRNLQRIKNYGETAEGKTKLCVQKPKTTKSMRVIPIADSLLDILKAYQKEPDQYLISGRKKEWAEIRTVQYRFASILKKCGLEQFHFHLLRHAFASRCIGVGCDMKSLSEMLGHSNIQITMNIYVHSSMQQKKEMVNHICQL